MGVVGGRLHLFRLASTTFCGYRKRTSSKAMAAVADPGAGVAEPARARSAASSSGRSSTSWIRPSAPSACPTLERAPKADPSGMIMRKRNIAKVTSEATETAPVATRRPPTPSTTSSDTFIARPATGTTNAEALATSRPAR
jgi:hypothetical protein